MGMADPAPQHLDIHDLGMRLPEGRHLRLPGRGTTYVRSAEGPPGAPTVLLLHGWLASGALNWVRCFEPLKGQFNVIAPDLRGHGRGIRSRRRFRLADCADDTAAMLKRLDTGPVIVVGYSMGGPVAQLLWRRHPDLVDGMVLIATGCEFVAGNRERYALAAVASVAAGTTQMGAVASWAPAFITRRLFGMELSRVNPGAVGKWAREEMSHHSVKVIFEAIHALATYSSKHWISTVNVPTSVIITETDRAVSPEAQLRLAMSIPDAHINRIDDGHTACINPDFGRKITNACTDVATRIGLAR